MAPAFAFATRKWDIDAEVKHCDTLHSALMTGARLALSRQFPLPPVVQLMLDWMAMSVPSAVNKLTPPQVLSNLPEAELQKAGDTLARGLERASGR